MGNPAWPKQRGCAKSKELQRFTGSLASAGGAPQGGEPIAAAEMKPYATIVMSGAD